jgi:hypothetical protein
LSAGANNVRPHGHLTSRPVLKIASAAFSLRMPFFGYYSEDNLPDIPFKVHGVFENTSFQFSFYSVVILYTNLIVNFGISFIIVRCSSSDIEWFAQNLMERHLEVSIKNGVNYRV